MDKICFINGSPRDKASMSNYLIEEIIKTIDESKFIINKLHINDILKNEYIIDEINDASKLIFVTPLYVDTLPGHLMEGLLKIESRLKINNINSIDTYAVLNCGFLEGQQNHIALDVFKNFCDKSNLIYKFGIGIGAGVFMNSSRSMPLHFGIKKPVYNAILSLSNDIQGKEEYRGRNILVNPSINKFLFKIMASSFWVMTARNNNVKIKDLYNTPYDIM